MVSVDVSLAVVDSGPVDSVMTNVECKVESTRVVGISIDVPLVVS